jgi:hypothetical protein
MCLNDLVRTVAEHEMSIGKMHQVMTDATPSYHGKDVWKCLLISFHIMSLS